MRQSNITFQVFNFVVVFNHHQYHHYQEWDEQYDLSVFHCFFYHHSDHHHCHHHHDHRHRHQWWDKQYDLSGFLIVFLFNKCFRNLYWLWYYSRWYGRENNWYFPIKILFAFHAFVFALWIFLIVCFFNSLDCLQE